MKRFATRSRRRVSKMKFACAALLPLALAACVSRGAYREVTAARDGLTLEV